ncbi:N-acetylglucosamine-6-phosphate deacetylase [Apiospora saccharicola]|uniref:N-acetylglucosamine-6-phosphate deacetylase n=1 Tax=Apiospora saccharicola TaxID=335842 RepID=A0ABR1W4Z4_9PEZI
MKTRCILLGLAAASQACMPGPAPASQPGDLIRKSEIPPPPTTTRISNVRVFNGDSFIGPQDVLMHEGYIIREISKCGDNKLNASSPQTTVIDGTGQYLIPGLVDSHAHVNSIGGLENFTSHGVTTVFNMNCANYTLCNALQKPQRGLAAFLTAGHAAVAPGSPHAVTIHVAPSDLYNETTQDPASWAAAVFGNNSDYVKIIAEPRGPSQKAQIGIVEATRKLGRKTMTHASFLEPAAQAIASKTDGIQHLPQDGLLSAAQLTAIRHQNQTLTATIEINRLAATDPGILAFLGVTGANATARGKAAYKMVQENARRAVAAGITVLAGTDAIGDLIPGVSFPFGATLHDELVNLVAAGMTPAQALRAATEQPARWYGLEDRGRVAPGRRADLVLLGTDPLADITNTQDIRRVWVGGVEYPHVVKRTVIM